MIDGAQANEQCIGDNVDAAPNHEVLLPGVLMGFMIKVGHSRSREQG